MFRDESAVNTQTRDSNSITLDEARLMTIEIKADTDKVLGGPGCRPSLRLELAEDGNALLHAGEEQAGQTSEEISGARGVWSASLPEGSYALADLAALEALAGRLQPLLARLAAGDYASSAEIQRLIAAAQWADNRREIWDADEWLSELGYEGAARDYGLTVDAPPATYRAAAMKIEADALREGIVLVNVDGVLQNIKHTLRESALKAA